nr:hypothetical protein [Bacillus pumilus]
MKITLIRNATLYLQYGQATFFIDPFFKEKEHIHRFLIQPINI